MNQQQMETFRKQLQALEARVSGDVFVLTEQTLSPSSGQAAGEVSAAPMHLADLGTEEYLQDLNATLLSNEDQLLAEIRDAQQRLDDGTYGKCLDCGKAITLERLKAIPYARYCILCSAEHELETPNLNHGRPREPLPAGPNLDPHAAGTAGGGTAVGGLAGMNTGDGDPDLDQLQAATNASAYKADVEQRDTPTEKDVL